MTIAMFLLLLLVSVILIIKRCRRLGVTFFAVAVIILIAAGCGLVPAILLNSLQAPFSQSSSMPQWKAHNVLIVLGGGMLRLHDMNLVRPSILTSVRTLAAARRYFACKKTASDCLIIASGGDTLDAGISEAQLIKAGLVELGVDAHDILIEDQSQNTYQNAEFSTSKLKELQVDTIYLVTSAFHLERALLYFSHFKIYPFPCAAEYFTATISLLPSAYNLLLTDIALHEYSGMIRFYIYNLLGLNASKTEFSFDQNSFK